MHKIRINYLHSCLVVVLIAAYSLTAFTAKAKGFCAAVNFINQNTISNCINSACLDNTGHDCKTADIKDVNKHFSGNPGTGMETLKGNRYKNI